MAYEEVRESLYERIDGMTAQQVDALPHGAIKLDPQGNILVYNRTEGEIAKLDPSRVIGKNFFTQVAPCTAVQEFYGVFKQGVAKKSLRERFRYRFEFKNQPPRDVMVSMFFSQQSDCVWVFVTPMDEEHP